MTCTTHMMAYICDLWWLHSTYDVLNREGVMTYRVDEMADLKGLKSDIELGESNTPYGWERIYCIWCHKQSVCHDIQAIVCCQQVGMWWILSAYGVIHSVGVISYLHRMWCHQSSVFFFRLYKIYLFFGQNTV